MANRRAVVIGTGVIGLCSAFELAQKGWQVTVISGSAKPIESASHGNGGIVVPSHFEPFASPGLRSAGLKMMLQKGSPFGVVGILDFEILGWCMKFLAAATRAHVERCSPILRDLNLRSRTLYETTYSNLDFGYERRGNLMLCQTRESFESEKKVAHEAQSLGLQVEVLDAQGLKDKEPHIESTAVGGVYFADDAHMTPYKFISALSDQLASSGVEFVWGADVTEFRREGLEVRAAKLARGDEIAGDVFVLAAGAHSGQLARKLGLKLPLLGGRGYGFTVQNPRFVPATPAILTDARVAMTPMLDGARFVGTMELGQPVNRPENRDRVEGMRKSIQSAFPVLADYDFSKSPVWSAYRPCPPDGMPYVGKTSSVKNMIIATGHAMMGMSLGPVTGELVANIAENVTPPVPLELLNPDRYA